MASSPYTNALNQVYDANTCDVENFRTFPIVIDRLRQLRATYAMSPSEGYSLEFGVFNGHSIRSMAHKFRRDHFHGFDSFEGLPEPWHLSDEAVYEAGHFHLQSLPTVPANVTLIKGFFDQTLEGWLEKNPGPVRFIHEDPDLYSSAKYTMDLLTDRIVDGTVIVFDELCDWEDSGIYPNWPEGEWKALREWLEATGLKFRILSRSHRFEAAIQVFRKTPPKLNAKQVLDIATAFWDASCRKEAITLLEERAAQKPEWLGGNYKLAIWLDKVKEPTGVLDTIERLQPALDARADHVYAVDVKRLRAQSFYRLGEYDAAFDEISAFFEKKPDHVGGLTLAAKCATACKNYEAAFQFWQRAFELTGDRNYRQEARISEELSELSQEIRTMKFSDLMINHLIHERSFETVLDVGSGAGEQANALRNAGKTVTELDYGKSKYFVLNPNDGGAVIGDFVELEIKEQFDCVVASHVLEHQLNVGAFLKKVHSVLREGGVVAISVPPAKPQIVGGHVTLWNAGLLLYNLVLAGFDCSNPWVRSYGYNISVVVEKKTIELHDLEFDSGDVDRIKMYLPDGLGEGFNGDIARLG